MIAIIFIGQGIQSSNMFDGYDRLEVQKFLEYSSELIGQDVAELLNLSESELNQSKNAQLLVTIYSCFVLSQWKKLNGPAFNYSAGHSVGEFTACFSADAFSYEELLKIVQFRATAMEEYLECNSGYIVHIYDKTAKEIEDILADSANQNLKIVGYNTLRSNQVAGETTEMDQFCLHLKEKNISFKKYNTTLPFHTTYLKNAGDHLHSFLEKSNIADRFSFPIISSLDGTEILFKEQLITALSQQIHMPILWTTTLTQLCKSGVTNFVIFCPRNKTFYKTIRNKFPDLSIWPIFGSNTLQKAIYELNESNTNHLA
jgi:malonyl CoA-acyl carrier protein transacylase